MKFCNDDIRFIENHFPQPYNTPETFGDYLLPKIQLHDTLCSVVIAEVKKGYCFLYWQNIIIGFSVELILIIK